MRLLIPCLLASLAACAVPPDTASGDIGAVPPSAYANTYVGVDPTTAGLDTAEEAFIHPEALRGHPGEEALALASLDALAGQLSSGGRFAGDDQIAQSEMLEARDQARAALGIRPGATSQQIIDALLATQAALDAGNTPAALETLSAPVFTKPPANTLALLNGFPHIPIGARATIDAQQLIYPQDGGGAGGGQD